MELSDWFKGFEKGIAKLTAEQREQFFSECGKHCVQCGTLQVYKEAKGAILFGMRKALCTVRNASGL